MIKKKIGILLTLGTSPNLKDLEANCRSSLAVSKSDMLKSSLPIMADFIALLTEVTAFEYFLLSS